MSWENQVVVRKPETYSVNIFQHFQTSIRNKKHYTNRKAHCNHLFHYVHRRDVMLDASECIYKYTICNSYTVFYEAHLIAMKQARQCLVWLNKCSALIGRKAETHTTTLSTWERSTTQAYTLGILSGLSWGRLLALTPHRPIGNEPAQPSGPRRNAIEKYGKNILSMGPGTSPSVHQEKMAGLQRWHPSAVYSCKSIHHSFRPTYLK